MIENINEAASNAVDHLEKLEKYYERMHNDVQTALGTMRLVSLDLKDHLIEIRQKLERVRAKADNVKDQICSKALNTTDKLEKYKNIRKEWAKHRHLMRYAKHRLTLGYADWMNLCSEHEIKKERENMRQLALERKTIFINYGSATNIY